MTCPGVYVTSPLYDQIGPDSLNNITHKGLDSSWIFLWYTSCHSLSKSQVNLPLQRQIFSEFQKKSPPLVDITRGN